MPFSILIVVLKSAVRHLWIVIVLIVQKGLTVIVCALDDLHLST